MTGTKRRRCASGEGGGGNGAGTRSGSAGGALAESLSTASVTSEGTGKNNKKRFVWPDDLHRCVALRACTFLASVPAAGVY